MRWSWRSICAIRAISREQVQDFYPTPGTLSTCMYYTGLDPRDMQPVYVPKNPHEKAMQRALLQYRNPANHDLVREALRLCGREDLIGFGPHALVPPRTNSLLSRAVFPRKGRLQGEKRRTHGSAPARSSVPASRRTDRVAPRREAVTPGAGRKGGGRS